MFVFVGGDDLFFFFVCCVDFRGDGDGCEYRDMI